MLVFFVFFGGGGGKKIQSHLTLSESLFKHCHICKECVFGGLGAALRMGIAWIFIHIFSSNWQNLHCRSQTAKFAVASRLSDWVTEVSRNKRRQFRNIYSCI